MDAATCVFVLPDGREGMAKNWPAASLPPAERWHVAVRDEGWHTWGPPLEVVHVTELGGQGGEIVTVRVPDLGLLTVSHAPVASVPMRARWAVTGAEIVRVEEGT